MTVYVDAARIPARVGRITARWSHLTATTEDELRAFADRLGLDPAWFQTCKRRCGREGEPCPHWHFDVTDTKRDQALAAGAEPIDLRGLGDLIRARRQASAASQPVEGTQ
jgi:hypothetical protein